MTGVMSASRDTQLAEAEKINLSIAKSLVLNANMTFHLIIWMMMSMMYFV